MSLIDAFKERCTFLIKSKEPDGEGGWTNSWADGAQFDAAIVFDTTMDARVAEKAGVTSRYTVTTDRAAKLEFHDVFRRERDGKVFRVTSDGDDVQTPDAASFQFSQVTAEEWGLS